VEGITPELFATVLIAQRLKTSTCFDFIRGTSYHSGCTAKYWLEGIVVVFLPRSKSPANTAGRTSVPNPRTFIAPFKAARQLTRGYCTAPRVIVK
jgi:glucosamine--fructose-6-phosphate aminotransferase (isomerizing)